MKLLILAAGLVLLIGGIPLIWKFAKGMARILLTLIIFFGSIALIWRGIELLASAF